jgi:excisionase family DNA binding protein
MALAKCPRCNKLFDKTVSPVCAACEQDEEADYDKIRAYVEESPGMTVSQVAEATGVAPDCILRMIDQGRIRQIALGEEYTCGRCGAPAISATKRLCERCLAELNAEFAEAQAKIKLPPKQETRIGRGESVRHVVEQKRVGAR